jgi:hypothetical protein
MFDAMVEVPNLTNEVRLALEGFSATPSATPSVL